MDPDTPAVKDATDMAYDKPNEVEQASNTLTPINVVDSRAIATEEEIETVETTTEEQLDASTNARSLHAKGTEMEAADNSGTAKLIADEDEEHAKENNVIMKPTSPDPVANDAVGPDQSGTRGATNVPQEIATLKTNNVNIPESEDKVNATTHAVEEAVPTNVVAGTRNNSDEDHSSVEAAPDKVLDDLAKYADLTSPILPEAINALDAEHEARNDATVETAEGDNAISLPMDDEKDYVPSLPTAVTNSVPHGDDEYDPANPSSSTPTVDTKRSSAFASERPTSKQEEYDPDQPSMSLTTPSKKTIEGTSTSSGYTVEEKVTMTSIKRKSVDESCATDQANGDTGCKRPRHDKHSSHNNNQKPSRPRREGTKSTSCGSSRLKHPEVDHKGLSDAAWDRLMDFQTSGEFQVTQVSRAAFACVGAMPEFAQIAIIAQFVRTPMKEVRDKNGELMRIYREYQKENPQIAALQPVDAFISDYKSDPGLFRFGYAPPQPATGVSTVQVPYQRNQPKEVISVKNSPRHAQSATSCSKPERHPPKDVDEFGRVVHSDKPGASEPSGSIYNPSQRSAVELRQTSRSRQDSSPHATQSTPRTASIANGEDPRRREQALRQSSSGVGRDPRRRGALTTQEQGQSDSPRYPGASGLYGRLPGPVKAVVDSMRREGRLKEPLNDNVITRMLHLPEHVALQAVENFSNVDLSQVENLQGFLVGIINRVNEKAIASEKQHRSQVPSPRGQSSSSLPRGGNYGASLQGASVLGGPPPGGRLNANNGVNAGGYHAQPAPIAAGPGPVLYERPYETPQDPRDPRRRQSAPHGAPDYGAVRGSSSVNGGHAPMGMPSFAALPISVQNHIHSLVANHTLASLEELGGKCYEVLGQLSEPLANQVLARFAGANLATVRNRSGFLIGVVKRARQEYGFN